MLDIKLIRKNPEEVEKKLRTKDASVSLAPVLKLDELLRNKQTRVQQLKALRNDYSKKIGEKKRKGESVDDLMSEVTKFSDETHSLDSEIRELETELNEKLAFFPNIPMDDIKVSDDPADNVILKECGKKPEFKFKSKNHLELNEKLNIFDFDRGAKTSGTGWPCYRGMGARLEWALISYMMEHHIRNDFVPWILPAVVREECLYNSGQLPKFKNQQYTFKDHENQFFMIPTAEVPLNGLHAGEILDSEALPLKYTAYTPCFRREAGAAGEKERGLIRVHQFNKVEMFMFCRPEQSSHMFDQMVCSAEHILQALGLHYRVALLVTGDMSFPSVRTIDLEVWLPGQNRYYEVSSISNCTDFQSRRSNTRFRIKGEKPQFIHTLNGSGLATSRLMVGILENNQRKDGSVKIPDVLSPYLGGLTELKPE